MLEYKYFNQINKYKLAVAHHFFKNIIVPRYTINNDPTSPILKMIQIPMVNSTNGKYYDIANSKTIRNNNTSNSRETSYPLPSMAIHINAIDPDPNKQLIQTNTINDEEDYVPTPFLISLDIAIVTKNEDDSLAIIEQILPNFADDKTLTVNWQMLL